MELALTSLVGSLELGVMMCSDVSLIVATRVHSKSASTFVDINKIINFINVAVSYGDKIVICLSVGDNLEHMGYLADIRTAILGLTCSEKIIIQPVCPWGNFTLALNAALRIAVDGGFQKILFQSLEVVLTSRVISILSSQMDEAALVVGPVLEGHDFSPGLQKLRGRTCPWNTAAIWSVLRLSKVGFPFIGDGVLMGDVDVPGGVEEVSAVALAQLIDPTSKAILLNIRDSSSIDWNTSLFEGDEERRRYHDYKMASKDLRPQKQLDHLGIAGKGVVHHIDSFGSIACPAKSDAVDTF